jgi:hypothetical protein
MRHIALLVVLAGAFALASSAGAQVVNGDFEAGGTGWSVDRPATWVPGDGSTIEFDAAGGNPNGFAYMHSPWGASGGLGRILQTFICGTDPSGECLITVDYRHRSVDASPLTGRVKIFVDGVLKHTSPPSNDQPWTTVTISAACGPHVLALCLEVDPGNNGWEAGFDNVTAHCDVQVDVAPSTWSTVKHLYY